MKSLLRREGIGIRHKTGDFSFTFDVMNNEIMAETSPAFFDYQYLIRLMRALCSLHVQPSSWLWYNRTYLPRVPIQISIVPCRSDEEGGFVRYMFQNPTMCM